MKNGLLMRVICLCLSAMTPAYSYAGFDQSHGNADLLHYVFYISVAVMVTVVMFCMVRLLSVDSADRALQENRHTQPWRE